MPWRAAGIRCGEGPESIERGVEITPELHWIQPLVEGSEFSALGGGQHAEGTQALIRSLGDVVVAARSRAGARLGDELLHGLEEVHVKAGECVHARELGIGGFGGEAIIA